MSKLLVYIPAYKNHLELAISQAAALKAQWNSDLELKIKHELEIYLSINGLDCELIVPEGVFDYVYHSRINIGWDANMNKGFLEALKIRPDYYWLLSCDDSVTDTALKKIFEATEISSEAKLIVTKFGANFEVETINKIFDISSEYSLGLISSIIYNFKYCELAFPSGFYYGWTGWGQISVLLKILNIYEDVEVVAADPKFFYERISYASQNNLLDNITKYQHSYYGNLLLRLANTKNKTDSKKVAILWVFRNLKFHNLYSKAIWPPSNEPDSPESINWRKNYVETLIKGNSIFSWLIYIIFSRIPIEFLINKYKSKSNYS